LFFIPSQPTDYSDTDLSIPDGPGKAPLLFTDAFVVKREAPAEVEMAARLFVAFMNSETVQEMLLMSGDVSPTA
jgi:hypothetical protein